MDAETLATLGVLTNNGMTVANMGYDGYFKIPVNDLIEIISELQFEVNISLTLANFTIDIETGICTFTNIKTNLSEEIDLETQLQLEQEIKTRLVRAYLLPSL